MPSPLTSSWLHRFALFTAAATFLLLGAGGLVTSHGVGMAVPDWPNTYGYNMFFFPVSRWVGGVFYEHTHRLLASAVGLLTAILALWFYGKGAQPFLRWTGVILVVLALATVVAAPKHWADGIVLGLTGLAAFGGSRVWPRCEASSRGLRWLGLAAFVAVVLQGILGGLRVVLFKDQIGILHATLAQLFFALACALALFTSRWWEERRRAAAVTLGGGRGIFIVATVLILGQLVVGATMRHQHAGLAIPDFPLAYGKLWPATDVASVARYNAHRVEVLDANPITGSQIGLQMVHRLLAAAILVTVGGAAWRARRRFGGSVVSTRLAWVWLTLIVCQALLGAATIWTNKAADVATIHVLTGSLSLALGVLLSIVSGTEPVAARRADRVSPAARAETSESYPGQPAPLVGLE